MTRYDLRIAGYILAVVIALGLALGYGVGWLTRPDREVPAQPAAEPSAFRPDTWTSGSGIPGYDELYVNDYANLLDRNARDSLRRDLIGLYDRTGIEMTVLTIGARGDYGFSGTNEQFATRLFNTWGIGNAARNDGVLVLVSRFDREMRIELGAGYGRDRDEDMKRVIDRFFIPYFKRDDYQGGILTGVDETIFALTGAYPGTYDSGTLARGLDKLQRTAKGLGLWLYALFAVPLGAAVLWVRRYLRFRPRHCPVCSTFMIRAGEAEDDAFLEPGQIVEEHVNSVDYDVWQCPSCHHSLIRRFATLWSGHEKCNHCGYRTLAVTTETLEAATTSSSGRMRVHYDCANCDHKASAIRTIPRISKSSSSGSGGSSFGGGSSSGGGASGSW